MSEVQILFDAIGGSHVYGLATEDSDLDKRGIFLQGYKNILLGQTLDQYGHDDEVYYEIKRFLDFVSTQNPNAIELLFTPEEFVLERHEILEPLFTNPERFLTKNIFKTLGGYAQNQIKKARGESKMIAKDPVDEKTPYDFMWVLKGHDTIRLQEFFNKSPDIKVALAKVPHTRDLYALYFVGDEYVPEETGGVVLVDDDEKLILSSVPKSISEKKSEQLYLIYNLDEYSKHKKRRTEYVKWTNNVNKKRFVLEGEQKRKYNAKNLMHAIRIQYMLDDFMNTGTLRLKVPQSRRDWLLSIKNAEVDYEDIVEESERLSGNLQLDSIDLPERFQHKEFFDDLLYRVRHELRN